MVFQIIHNIEDLSQSLEEKAIAVQKSEEGAADLKKRVEDLSKSLEEHEKEYQVNTCICHFMLIINIVYLAFICKPSVLRKFL